LGGVGGGESKAATGQEDLVESASTESPFYEGEEGAPALIGARKIDRCRSGSAEGALAAISQNERRGGRKRRATFQKIQGRK